MRHDGRSDPLGAEASAAAAARQILQAGEARASTEMPDGLQYLSEKEQLQDRELKLSYATWLRRSLTRQLAIADAVFIAYAWAGKNWNLEAVVINVWLGATVVQVVGVVLVVTRHLFPQRDRVVVRPSHPDG